MFLRLLIYYMHSKTYSQKIVYFDHFQAMFF